MNERIERFGAFLERQLPDHPDRVRKLLSLVYRAVSFQAGRFPNRNLPSSREHLQAYTAGLLSSLLRDAGGSAVVNLFLPCEILHALDIPVMAPEALAVYVVNTACEAVFLEKAEEAGAPMSLCSYHRTLLGLAESGVLQKPAFVAYTTLACDATQLSFRHLAELWSVPRVAIDIPYTLSDDGVAYVADQLRHLTRVAEETTKKKLDPDRLRECMLTEQRSFALFKKALSMRSDRHLPEALTPEMLSVVCNHLYAGLPCAEEYCKKLVADLSRAPALTTQKKVLWVHVLPNWQESVKSIFQGKENDRVEIVGCDLAFDGLIEPDPEHPYESMARRAIDTAYNGPGQRRIDSLLHHAKILDADGILIFCQWGCKQTQGIALAMKKAMENEGYPTLVVDGDGCDRSNGGSEQIVTRLQAFLEQMGA